ncbi:MAG: hypothetical protein WEC37_03800 [Anaerolineales bacterium]
MTGLLTPGWRKFTLATHLALSVGWIGAVVVYIVFVVAAMNTSDEQTLRAMWAAMDLSGRLAIVPLALGSLVTGLIISMGTKWGLIRYYWVLISLVLTLIATLVLLEHMQTVSLISSGSETQSHSDMDHEMGSQTAGTETDRLRSGLPSELLHSGLGLMVLIVVQVLNIYKPQGMTPYGWRKRKEPPRFPVI